jgi:hypothetical protein
MRVTTLSDNDYETVERIFKQVFDRSKWEQDFQEAWRKKDKESSLGAYSEDGKLLAYAITTRKESYTFLEFFAVDPVEMISTPAAVSALPISSNRSLS